MSTPLPSFERPPVGEVILAAHFLPLDLLRSYHYGTFAAMWRDRYPVVEDMPTIRELNPASAPIQLLDTDATPRAWFVSADNELLVQVQRDRLVHNWRRTGRGYPRYTALRPRFAQVCAELSAAAEELALGDLAVHSVEISYVNPIPLEGPAAAGRMTDVLAPLGDRYSDDFLPDSTAAGFRLEYEIKQPDTTAAVGTLAIAANPVEGPSGKAILLELTARGRPLGNGLEGILAFHDLGHEWVVRGFTSVTTPMMHDYWGRVR